MCDCILWFMTHFCMVSPWCVIGYCGSWSTVLYAICLMCYWILWFMEHCSVCYPLDVLLDIVVHDALFCMLSA